MAITKATIARQMSNRIAYNKARRAAAARIKRAEEAGFIGAVLPKIPDHPPNKRDIDKLQNLTRKEIERRAVQAIDPRTGEEVSKKELRKRNKAYAEEKRQKSRKENKKKKEALKALAKERLKPKEPPTVSDAVLSWAEDLISGNLADSPRRANKARSVLQDKIAKFGRDAVAQAFEELGDTIKGYLEMVFIYEEDESRERDSYFLWRFIHALDGIMPDSVADLSEDEFMDFYGISEEE